MPRERTRSRSSAVPNSVSAEESSSEDVLAARARTLATASEALLIRRPHRRQRHPCRTRQLLEESSVEGRLLGTVHRDLDLTKHVTAMSDPDRERVRAGSDRRRPHLRPLLTTGQPDPHLGAVAVRSASSRLSQPGHHLTHRQRVRHPGKQLPHQPVAVRTLAEAEPIGQHRDRTTGQRQQARDQNSGRHHHPQRPPSRGRYQVSPAQRQQRIPDNSNCKSATDDGPRALDIRSHRAPTHSPAADATAHTPGQGTLPTICVPLPGADSTTSEPPSTATRSANLATPPTESRAPDWLNPTPSSLIAKRNSASPLWMSIRTLVARACLAMFCKASTQQKYTPAASCESSAGGTST